MATIVKQLNFKRKKGMLYFINREGDLTELKPTTKHQKVVARTGIIKEKGCLYFLDKQGNIAKTNRKSKP
ncbi:MAG: hypothetical protein CMD31_13140 [Flavobacteriales bacterium]|jgi:hypothetical protein|nr:hypothetical protein [Flavobacteriales bacterium]|tara:strand:- start:48959 stop:49168 length:210 start_codon:yes stop_codon:yes gene_type:complete